MTKETLAKLKESIITTLLATERLGVSHLIEYMDANGFFTAPSSTVFHNNFEGGLALHSVNVTDLLFKKNEDFSFQYSSDTLSITGLLHDLCKMNYYEVDEEPPTDAQIYRLNKELKINGHKMPFKLTKSYASNLIDWYVKGHKGDMPVFSVSYKVNEQFPFGHGEKSAFIAQRFIELTEEEAIAIRWHMQAFDAGIHFNYPSGFPFRNSMDRYPLVTMLITADLEASQLLEHKA